MNTQDHDQTKMREAREKICKILKLKTDSGDNEIFDACKRASKSQLMSLGTELNYLFSQIKNK